MVHRVARRLLHRIAEEGFWSVLPSLGPKEMVHLARAAADSYYNSGVDLLEDSQYDALLELLEETPEGRRYRAELGAPVRGTKVTLPYHMGSMDKIKEEAALLNWLATHQAPYLVGDKLDGVSLLCHHHRGRTRLYTRGDGDVGQDVSHLLPLIQLPPSALERGGRDWAVRGEAIMRESDWQQWAGVRKNPRSTVAGLINTDPDNLDPEMVRAVRLVAFEVVEPQLCPSQWSEWLSDRGWQTVYTRRFQELSLDRLTELYARRQQRSRYEIDGLVITEDHCHPPVTVGNPEYAFAFKGVREIATTEVREIQWNPSKDGYLIPTVLIRPVTLGRSTVKRATGIHARNIVENRLGPGAIIQIIKSGEIIPRIIRVLEGVDPVLPEGGVWDANEVHLILEDPETNREVQVTRLTKFVVDIGVDGLSRGIVDRLWDAGYQDIPTLLRITARDLARLEGFGERSADKIRASLDRALSNLDLLTLMVASNLLGRSVSRKRLRLVLDAYPEIVDQYRVRHRTRWEDRIGALHGWGDKMTALFLDHLPVFQEWYLQFTAQIPVAEHQAPVVAGDQMAGESVVFSGFRKPAWEAWIIEQGGQVKSGVSKQTTLLVWAEGTGAKYQRAVTLGIPRLSRLEFAQRYGLAL